MILVTSYTVDLQISSATEHSLNFSSTPPSLKLNLLNPIPLFFPHLQPLKFFHHKIAPNFLMELTDQRMLP
jgi:hypothetical protein